MGEIKSLISIWCSVFVSLTYCYFLLPKLPKGTIRILCILPIIYLFMSLPWQLTSIHLRTVTAFYLAWLCTFKLLLLCFNTGPLSQPLTQKSLIKFIFIASFPIKVKTQSPQNPENPSSNLKTLLNLSIKGALLALIIHIYTFKQNIHPKLLLALYSLHVFLALEVILVSGAALVRVLMGLELEPQFNKPYLTTSLQDFWGRRWNLIVTNILRPTVYEPVRRIFQMIVGNEEAKFPATVATFIVSGLMHELIFYYMTYLKPTWEVTCFFVLHGFCTATEVAVKRKLPANFRLSRAVSAPLTIGFLFATCLWLFFPPMTRNGADAKAIEEYHVLAEFFAEKLNPMQLNMSYTFWK